MKELLIETIKYLKQKGVQYADLRYIEGEEEAIVVQNALVDNISNRNSSGIGIRVLFDGYWGFTSTSYLDIARLHETADEAVELARLSSILGKEKIVFQEQEPVVDKFLSKFEIDPFSVSLQHKLDYLFWASQILLAHKNIKTAICGLDFYKTKKVFLNTEGSVIEQEFIESLGYIEAIAILENELQIRSYPASHKSAIAQAGYEYIKGLDLVGGAKRIKNEVISLLRAKECPSKETTVIMDGPQLALQVHESCGHPAELDRVLGYEMSFAGGSFLTPEKLGKFRYGSNLVNIVADATIDGSVGSFGYDDEGIKSQRSDIIKDGVFAGYLTSRETAGRLNQKSNGCMRSENWNYPPLIRMTNINLLPGKPSLEELISDTKDGIFVSTNKSWSIDDKRLNFQFGAEIAWEIKNGKLGQVFKNPLYTGITPTFWKSCSGIADKDSWRVWGVPNCGKGEPVQTMHVGHGASAARFENVLIGRIR
jgi:TldD protein